LKILKKALLILGSILALLILVYAGYGCFIVSRVNPMPEVKKFTDRAGMKIRDENYLFMDKYGDYIILPGMRNNNEGVIIYPAAFTDYRSYIPVAYKIADDGYAVFIAKMPFRLSILNTENGLNYIKNYKNINKWYIIGHSLGGIAASVFASNHADKISGLILWASGPLPDLKKSGIKVLLVCGTRDGFFSRDGFNAAKKRLPADAKYYIVEGGNHSQFAWYPDMPGDLKAGITREEQERLAIGEVLNFMK